MFIIIVRPCILVSVFLLLSMYSYRCLCILIVVYVFLDAATLTASVHGTQDTPQLETLFTTTLLNI